MLTEGKEQHSFQLCRVFGPDASQSQIFACVGQQLVDDVLEGYNATIFAYGQTGSGKTYTMLGPDWRDDDLKGIIPRAAEQLFAGLSRALEGFELSIKCSVLEIYKEKVFDLLDPQDRNLQIKEGVNGIYVEGLTALYVISVEELLAVLDLGASNRSTAVTKMNKVSSRSHQLVQIEVAQGDEMGREVKGKFNLVDLAGSEKASAIADLGENFEELKKINLSLSALGKVIHSLTSSADHIPYRDSKLTRLLQESLSGNFKTSLIVTCSPHTHNTEETISSLRFGVRAGALKTTVKRNLRENREVLIAELQGELSRCRTELQLLRQSGESFAQITDFDRENHPEIAKLKEEIADLESKLARKSRKIAEIDKKFIDLMDSSHNAAFHYSETVRKLEDLTAKNTVLEQINSELETKIEQLQFELKSKNDFSSSNVEFIERNMSEFPIFSRKNSPKVDNFSPEIIRREFPIDPNELISNSLYASNVKTEKETCSTHCFLLRNQLIQAGFLNASMGQAYEGLQWRLHLTEMKLDLSEQTVGRLEKHVKKQQELIGLLQSLCTRLHQTRIDDFTPVKFKSFVRKVDRHSQRARDNLRSFTPLDSASPGTVSDIRFASPYSFEPDDCNRVKILRTNLDLQETQNAQLHELLAAKSKEADTLNTVIHDMEQMSYTAYKLERAKWSEYIQQYRENCEMEIMRKHNEAAGLSKALAKWVERYTDMQSSMVAGGDTTWRFEQSLEQGKDEEMKTWGRSLFFSETSVLSEVKGGSIEMEELGRSRGDMSPIDPED